MRRPPNATAGIGCRATIAPSDASFGERPLQIFDDITNMVQAASLGGKGVHGRLLIGRFHQFPERIARAPALQERYANALVGIMKNLLVPIRLQHAGEALARNSESKPRRSPRGETRLRAARLGKSHSSLRARGETPISGRSAESRSDNAAPSACLNRLQEESVFDTQPLKGRLISKSFGILLAD